MTPQLPKPLNELDEVHQAILIEHLKPVSFPAGSCIFKFGAPGDCCYIIDEGRIRLEIPVPGSQPGEHTDVLKYLEAGELLGEMALLDRLPRSASAFAQTEVKARLLHSDDLDGLQRARPHLVSAIYAALGRQTSLKLRQTTDRLGSLLYPTENPKGEK